MASEGKARNFFWKRGNRGNRGRGGRGGRGNFRGRGGKFQPQTKKTREELDAELDSYMANTRTVLDKDLDEYMSQAK